MSNLEQGDHEANLFHSFCDNLSLGHKGMMCVFKIQILPCNYFFAIIFIYFLLLENMFTAKVSPGVIAPSCMVIGSNQGFHPAMGSPLNTSIENAFSHQSSSLSKTMPSPMRMTSASKQFGFCESSNSLDEMKFSNQGINGFHAHSFPENHDSMAHGIPRISPTAIANGTSLGPGIREGYVSHVHGVNANGHPMELKGGML